jgi:hypothetical protein
VTLPLPGAVGDPATQQALDEIARQFPIGPPNLSLRVQNDFDFFGPEPRASNALIGDASASGYNFPGSALSASTRSIQHYANARLTHAVFDVAWNPQGDAECGIQLVSFKEGPSEIKEVHSFTGSGSATPIHSTQDVTDQLQTVWAEVQSTKTTRFLGHRLKSHTGVIAPIVFMSRVTITVGGG